MPGGSGWDVIDYLREHSPETVCVISTGHGDRDDAIRAIRMGAYDFLPKPVSLFEIANVLDRIGEKKALQNKTIALESRLQRVEGKSNLIGNSAPMMRVHKLIEKIAPTDSAVLILGETGTGKEMVARRIHEMSERRDAHSSRSTAERFLKTLSKANSSDIEKAPSLELIRTGQGSSKSPTTGRCSSTNLGNLINPCRSNCCDSSSPAKCDVGDNEPFHVDVRIVCATNRELQQMVAEGTFREDLFFRINTFEIYLPPLRERLDDIPGLALHLIARHLKRESISPEMLPPDTIKLLQSHHWSGNVRELANVLEHAVILSDGKTIKPEDLPRSISRKPTAGASAPATTANAPVISSEPKTLREMEEEMILRVLDKYAGDKPKAAKELGIALKTLYNRLSQMEQQRHAG